MKLQISTLAALLAIATVSVAQERAAQQPAQQERPAVRQQDDAARTQATRRGVREGGQVAATAGSLNPVVAAQLIIANQEEIQINQFAMDKIQNEQAKQFAQKMIEEHQQVVSQLQRIVPGEMTTDLEFTSAPRGQQGADGQQRSPGQQRLQNQQRSQDQQRDAQDQLDRQLDQQRPAQDDAQGAQGQDAQTRARQPQTDRTRESAAGQTGAGDTHLTAALTRGGVMHQLLMIDREKAQHCLAISQQQLQQADPSAVDQVYLGQQVAMHASMLAHLRALDGHVDGELQQLVSQGEKKTQEHLQMAEQIMKQLGSSNQGNDAPRDSNTDRNQ